MSVQPTEAELIREAIASALSDAHTSIPARVLKYNPATATKQATVDCEIVILRAEQAESGATIHERYPNVPNVPIGWPSGGGYSLQFPLNPGDGVWLVFSEAAIANWRETGDISPPGDLDRFDISYPIALPCARHDKQLLPAGTGALLTVPDGGSFAVSTAGGEPKAVAMAEEVNANFQAIKDLLTTTWVPVPNDGGAALKTAASSLTFEPTDSVNLKAQ